MSVKLVPLAQVLQFIRGITFKPEDLVEPFVMGSAICMRTKNIQNELDQSDLIAVPQQFVKRDEQYIESGDLLISSANSWELVGKTVRVPEIGYKCTAGGFISILRPIREAVDSDYLFRFIMHEQTQHDIRHLGRQTTNISNLDRKRFLELKIPLPPLPIQKQIAAVLEKADTLRQQCQQMEQELNALAQSVFLEMFGDPVTNPKGWTKVSLKAISTKFNDGPFGSNLKTSHYTDSGVQVIRLTNIGCGSFKNSDKKFVSEEHAEFLSKFKCYPGDIIIATLGDPNLRSCIIPEEVPVAINKADCVHCVPDSSIVSAEYLSEFLNLPFTLQAIQNLLHGQTRTRISSGQLANVEVILPPLDKQSEFVRFMKYRDNELQRVRDLLHKKENLFNSLIQRAFKGELDLTASA